MFVLCLKRNMRLHWKIFNRSALLLHFNSSMDIPFLIFIRTLNTDLYIRNPIFFLIFIFKNETLQQLKIVLIFQYK